MDFNDAGNGAFAGATQVQQTIIVGNGGPKVQSPLYLTSLDGTKYSKLTLTTAGGSGTRRRQLHGDAGDGELLAEWRRAQLHPSGHVHRHGDQGRGRYVLRCLVGRHGGDDQPSQEPARPARYERGVDRSQHPNDDVGTGFYGQPTVKSSVGTTHIGVSSDNGKVLTIVVTVAKNAPRGIHTMTLTFAHGDRTSVLYNQR